MNSGKLPWKQMLWKRWIVIDNRWKRKEPSRLSLETVVKCRPSSVRNCVALWFIGPNVSNARGMNLYVVANVSYFCSFLSAAASEALPGVNDVLCRYESARVSVTVTSQVMQRPPCHGISVSPSGRLPSDLSSPAGSFTDGMPARFNARYTMSLMQ